jgi:pimeloyl-ACP methyl ester carboxylesterase
VFIGTSLGGLVTMIIATVAPERIAGVLLNDVGPELNLVGIERIKTYVGKSIVFGSLEEAAAELRGRHSEVHPAYGDKEWERYARRVVHQTDRGFEFDYDMRIAEPFDAANSGEVPDIWPYYRALAGRPVLVLRGEYSDLLPDAVLKRMASEIPDVEIVTVPGVGHAPDLDEPEAEAAIDRLLERVLRR